MEITASEIEQRFGSLPLFTGLASETESAVSSEIKTAFKTLLQSCSVIRVPPPVSPPEQSPETRKWNNYSAAKSHYALDHVFVRRGGRITAAAAAAARGAKKSLAENPRKK